MLGNFGLELTRAHIRGTGGKKCLAGYYIFTASSNIKLTLLRRIQTFALQRLPSFKDLSTYTVSPS